MRVVFNSGVVAVVMLCCGHAAGLQESVDDFTLIDRELRSRSVQLVAINESSIATRNDTQHVELLARQNLLGLIRNKASASTSTAGAVTLVDGQHIPGELDSSAYGDDGKNLAWVNGRVGQMTIPLDQIMTMTLVENATPPVARDADVLQLVNGDHITGFVARITDTVTLEVDDAGGEVQTLSMPTDRIATVSFVNTPRPSDAGRIWLRDGTAIDVDRVDIGDDGIVRLHGVSFGVSSRMYTIRMHEVLAVRIEGATLRPLASIEPVAVEGPPTRLHVPPPRVLEARAPLDLSDIELRGPLTVTYAMPESPVRVAMDIRLDEDALVYGDCDIIVRDGDRKVFSAHLGPSEPRTSMNIIVQSSMLTIEIEEGAHGPISDHVILEKPMLSDAR